MITTAIFTERLQLKILTDNDHPFILELVNTPGWLQFIGDRNIKTEEQAKAYIQKVTESPQIYYWTVTPANENRTIGIITLVKREYLEHFDLGFAFLPDFEGKGYAAEATRAVMYSVPEISKDDKILAITTEENHRSVKLLEKLKFCFDCVIEADDKTLWQYALSKDHLLIGKSVHDFYRIFSNTFQQPEFDRIYELCSSFASIIKKSGDSAEIYDLESFIDPRKKILTDGTLTEFSEWETAEETRVVGNIAQRYSTYRKKGMLHGKYFEASGHKIFQLMKENGSWKIVHVIWEDEG